MPDAPGAGQPLLEVQNLVVRYGPALAVQGIDLTVGPGEAVALLGANGAGKSSTLLAVSGLVGFRGHVRFDGADLAGVAPHLIAQRGLVQVPEVRAIFPDLTVAENLEVAGYTRRRDPHLTADRQRLFDVLPRLADLRARRAGTLSGGEQQMVVLAKAILARPRLLLVDELSLGLAPKVVAELFTVLGELHRQGTAILIVEQFVPLALGLAERVYVLEKGRVVDTATSAELREDRGRVAARYLGAGLAAAPGPG